MFVAFSPLIAFPWQSRVTFEAVIVKQVSALVTSFQSRYTVLVVSRLAHAVMLWERMADVFAMLP